MSNIDPNKYIPQNILDAYWFARSQPEFVGTFPPRVDVPVNPNTPLVYNTEPQMNPAFFDISVVRQPLDPNTWFNHDGTTGRRNYHNELLEMTAEAYRDMGIPKELLESEQPKILPRHITNAIMELEI